LSVKAEVERRPKVEPISYKYRAQVQAGKEKPHTMAGLFTAACEKATA
jgi:hypothetical protein